MSYDKTVAAIVTGAYDQKLDELSELIRQRRKNVASTLAYTIKVGDIVVLQNIRPKHIVGEKAEVIAINRTTVTVVMIRDKGKSFAPPSRVPLQCCRLEKAMVD
jgi:hypothetical protein